MNARDERLAELLRRVLEEDLDPASEEALHMDEDDDIAGSLARSEAVIGLLERSASEQRADLAAGELDPRHAAQVRRFVDERVSPRRTPWFALAGLAAAAALVVWIAPWGGNDAPTAPELHLGADGAVRLDADGLRWEHDLPAGGWYEVVVFDAQGVELERSDELGRAFWPIDTALRAAWPTDATFEVEVLDGTGRLETTLRSR
ncbi:MAG TPA: hypothetical protein VNB06_11110 [Thermoanaerobaculia bacterium]|nr:hypothetical protein [Thermoanaerobaculia bacterium]